MYELATARLVREKIPGTVDVDAGSRIHMFTMATSDTGPLGLIEFSSSAAAEREIVLHANEEPSYIDLSYDTKLKSNSVSDTTKTSELPGAEPAARRSQRQVGSYFCEMSIGGMYTRNVPTLLLMTTYPAEHYYSS